MSTQMQLHTKVWQETLSTTNETHIEHGEKLFSTGIFSDCQIHCKGRSWNLHRAILATRCDFFRACFTFCFDESSSSENRKSVSMEDDNPDALERMLRYLYTYTYPMLDTSSHEIDSDSQTTPTIPSAFWTSELALLLIADKYSLLSLQTQATSSIIEAARTYISDPTSDSQCDNFINQIEDFVEMMETLFTDSAVQSMDMILGFDIKREILDATGEMIAKFIANNEKLVELMVTVPDFGVMLVQVLGVRDECTSDEAHGDERQDTSRRQTNAGSGSRRSRYDRHNGSVSSETGSGSWSGSDSSSSRYNASKGTVRSQAQKRVKGARGRRQASPERPVVKVHIPMNEDSDLD